MNGAVVFVNGAIATDSSCCCGSSCYQLWTAQYNCATSTWTGPTPGDKKCFDEAHTPTIGWVNGTKTGVYCNWSTYIPMGAGCSTDSDCASLSNTATPTLPNHGTCCNCSCTPCKSVDAYRITIAGTGSCLDGSWDLYHATSGTCQWSNPRDGDFATIFVTFDGDDTRCAFTMLVACDICDTSTGGNIQFDGRGGSCPDECEWTCPSQPAVGCVVTTAGATVSVIAL